MSKPLIENRISLGNVIQIVLLLTAIAGGASVALYQISDLKASVSKIEREQESQEERLGKVEITTAMQGVDFNAMGQTLTKLEEQLSENNRLLRAILAKSSEH